jgi:DNA-damage-inducible protein J
MSQTTTIQIRIDQATKKEAQKIFEDVGLDISSAVKVFFRQVINTRSIPFEVRTVNGFTPAYEKMIKKEVEWAKKHAKRYTDVKELLKDLKK